MIISGMDTVLLNQDYIKKMNDIMEKENELYNQKDSKTDSSILNKDNTSTVGGKEAGTEEQAKNANSEGTVVGKSVVKDTTGSGTTGTDTGSGLNSSNTLENNLNSIMLNGGDYQLRDEAVLMTEILATQGSLGMHPITGEYLKTGVLNEVVLKALKVTQTTGMTESDIIKSYRNKLFGSGFQFLDSVDRRFEEVNEFVGYEYLRNFINHSAILHIYPGLPYYQGGGNRLEWLSKLVKGIAQDASSKETAPVTKEKPEATTKLKKQYDEVIKFEANQSYIYDLLKEGKSVNESDLQFMPNLMNALKEKKFYDPEKKTFQLPTEKGKVTQESLNLLDDSFAYMKRANELIKDAIGDTNYSSEKENNADPGKGTNVSKSGTLSGIEQMLFSIFFSTKYQQRLFTIRYTYEQYMRYVNLMCRSAALFLNLTVQGQSTFPQGTLVNSYERIKQDDKNNQDKKMVVVENNFKGFHEIDWSNYRMMESANTVVKNTWNKSLDLIGSVFTHVGSSFVNGLKGAAGFDAALALATPAGLAAESITKGLTGYSIADTINNTLFGDMKIINENLENITKLEQKAESEVKSKNQEQENIDGFKTVEKIHAGIKNDNNPSLIKATERIWNLLGNSASTGGQGISDLFAMYGDIRTQIEERTQSVEFMVEPISPDEQFTNQTGPSQIKQGLDQAAGIGSEVAFITQTNAIQDGAFGKAMEGAMSLGKGIFDVLNGLTKNVPLGGSFIHNLVSGAIGAVTGNRYIFPDIYQNSSSSASYNFKVNLITPYGDIYNYYMNIVVPLIHLYCLAWPRLVTANSSNCPFIVKAFIPGLMTCEMGVIDSMRVQKNSEGNRVSVNGFPLSVTVEFSIHELYHHNAISPWDDPLSVLNNECLLDYLSNMAGIHPTYARKQLLAASLSNVLNLQTNFWAMLGNYFGDALLGWFGMRFN